jgi:general nucleoside transport system permease protein
MFSRRSVLAGASLAMALAVTLAIPHGVRAMTDAALSTSMTKGLRGVLRPSIVISVAAVLAAALVGLVLIFALGVSVSEAIAAFIDGTLGTPYAIAASVNRSIAFALVGIGFVIANRANLVNVGGEGQIAVGGIAATAVALYGHVDGLPAGLAFILPLLAAVLAGMLWGSIAGILKIKAGTNEVISTLLLSFIAVWLLYWCVQSPQLLRKPMTSSATLPESLEVPEASKLPLLTGDFSFPLHIGLPITVVIAIVAGIVLAKTLFGLQLRAVGFNPVAASRADISYVRMVMISLATAGALGGLAGGFMLLGEQYVLKDGFSSGYGFDGLVAGLLARGSVVGVIAAALLFGFLRSGGINMEMVAGVPTALVMVIQGLIVVTLAGAAYFMGRRA